MHDQKAHHRRSDGIVYDYTDLTTAEINMLTKILSHAPKQRNSTLVRAYEQIVRDQTTKLPSHLRTKIPWISSFCSLHNRINPFPVNSVLEWLKDEVDRCVPEVWSPLQRQNAFNADQSEMLILLQDMSSVWNPPSEKKKKHGLARSLSVSRGPSSTKCTACILAQIGGNEQWLIALGAFFIGRVHSSIWKRSKRIQWAESWVRDAVGDDKADQTVRKMWQLGIQLRELRKNANVTSRSYVDEYVEQARSFNHDQPQKRPHREDATVRHQGDGGWLSQVAAADDLFDHNEQQPATADDPFDDENTWKQLQPSMQDESEPPAGPTADIEVDTEASRLFRVPSSIYSQDSGWSQASSHDMETQLIDLYRHSVFPRTSAEEETNANSEVEVQRSEHPRGRYEIGQHPWEAGLGEKPDGTFF